MLIVDRETGEEIEFNYSKITKFLYNNFFGRCILKLLTNKVFANTGALFMKSFFSKPLATKKIKKYNIDMTQYKNSKYKCYNDFFTREKKQLDFDENKDVFISPSDSKLMIFKMDETESFKVKGSLYNANEIIEDSIIKDFKDGYALIFRLDVNDYHHYIYIDDGTRSDYKFIKGLLHTVQPIAYDKVKVFHRNSREWCILKTANFDDIVQVEVGALLVGKIRNNAKKKFNKGDEKGYFEFGGSTILLFIKKDIVEFDEDILKNSKFGKETIVKCGEKIGLKKK